MNKTYYGLTDLKQLETIAIQVCECLGGGTNNTAINMLLETAGAETGKGTVIDGTKFAGMGITQFDGMPFQDVIDRTRQKHKDMIIEYFNINIEWVQWEHLRYNPLLAMIFTRLKYKLVPELIPNSLEARARYWKVYYNTEAGKGDVEHYLGMNA